MKKSSRFTSAFVILLLSLFSTVATAQKQAASLCPLSAILSNVTASGATQAIAIPTATAPPIFINGVATTNPNGPKIVICRVDILVNQASGAADFGLVQGTGTNCATGQTDLTPQWVGTASVIDKYQSLFGSQPLQAKAGKAVCLKLSAAPTKAQVLIVYGVFSN